MGTKDWCRLRGEQQTDSPRGIWNQLCPATADGFGAQFFDGFDGSNFISSKTGRKGNGNDPAYFWDTPYPLYTATLPNYDPAQLNDGSIGYYPNDLNRYPKVQNWNFGIQFELPWQTRLEANYVGSKGTRLPDAYKHNIQQLDPSYLSLGDTLLEDIADHPEIKMPYPSFSGTVGQALLPFPQYRGISTPRPNSGWSNYHSLQITATKRMSTGLSFLVAYTFSKNLWRPTMMLSGITATDRRSTTVGSTTPSPP